MNDTRTASILQRVPAILAVTASAYGLPWRAEAAPRPAGNRERSRNEDKQASGRDKPAAQR